MATVAAVRARGRWLRGPLGRAGLVAGVIEQRGATHRRPAADRGESTNEQWPDRQHPECDRATVPTMMRNGLGRCHLGCLNAQAGEPACQAGGDRGHWQNGARVWVATGAPDKAETIEDRVAERAPVTTWRSRQSRPARPSSAKIAHHGKAESGDRRPTRSGSGGERNPCDQGRGPLRSRSRRLRRPFRWRPWRGEPDGRSHRAHPACRAPGAGAVP